MATIERTGLMTYIDEGGNHYILYPVTTVGAVDGLLEALNSKLSMELLWQNSKPTSEFGAYDVELDLTPFDYITIDYAPIATAVLKTAFCKVGGACLLDAVSGSSNASSGESGMGGSHVYSVWRNAICTDKAKVHFTKAVRQAQDSSSVGITDSNFYVIPVRIYGIKGVST